ncbi:toll/interleukin-1 receptor domain-containing protein [Rhodococcus erythropolis]|uniref:toll/interleukin-1 receptor domain-containing protein n=1 Tax=Rhodococcus erythropolis TaxID=1833 RepID=UPI001F2536B9|nr:toll/interleukin-1 receptor domain-containing protein [Rhodococcus erythropolis]UJC79939.1 toll/interleukin-1 receptor domain-containing protein [Rhodococcus erythropolis]
MSVAARIMSTMPNALIVQNLGRFAVPEPKVFISHAHADLALAKLVRDTLIRGGVPNDRVFFSSSRSTGIPTGADVVGHLREQLNAAGLVIELISQTFITRPMCLMELGGAWSLKKSTFPVVIPPLTRVQAIEAIGSFQMADLGDPSSARTVWFELQDRIKEALHIDIGASTWSEAVSDFADAFATLPASASSEANAQVAPETPSEPASDDDDEIAISNVTIRGNQLHGEATNRDAIEHSATLTATFYAEDGSIAGTGGAAVVSMKPGRTKTFTVLSVPKHARYKVDVDSVL